MIKPPFWAKRREMLKMGVVLLMILIIFCHHVSAMTDQEMYTQLANYLDVHSRIPADKALVARISSSTQWLALKATYGSTDIKKNIH